MLKCTPSRYRIRKSRLQRALAPGFKLLGERLIQAADRAGAGSDAHQGLGDFSYLMGTRSGHEHLRQPFCDMGLIATVALKGLRVKLSFTISGDLDLLEPTSGYHPIAAVRAITVPFAFRAALTPSLSDERL